MPARQAGSQEVGGRVGQWALSLSGGTGDGRGCPAHPQRLGDSGACISATC